MRIWLDADKLHGYSMSAAGAGNAVRAQNVQIAAGSVGSEPAVKGTGFTATVLGESRFTTAEQFENIILRANADGTTVRLKDVARVEIGPGGYGRRVVYNGRPCRDSACSSFGCECAQRCRAVKTKMVELQATFPPGVSWFVPYDTTQFIKISIEEVVKTLSSRSCWCSW